MEPLVSIIIPAFDDDTYLIRCLNSIKRQTYQNYEIIIADTICDKELKKRYKIRLVKNNEDIFEKLNEAMKIASGKYFMFCNVEMILSPDVLRILVKRTEEVKNQIFYNGQCCQYKNVKFENVTGAHLYAKLFLREKIESKNLYFINKEMLTDIQFVINYLNDYNQIETEQTAYVYGTEFKPIAIEEQYLEEDAITKFFECCENTSVELYDIKDILNQKLLLVESKNKILIATKIKEIFGEAYEENYTIAKRYISVIFKKCIEEKDREIFEVIKRYLELFKNEKDFLKVFLPLFDMNEEQYESCLRNTLENYVFYKDKLNNTEKDFFGILERLNKIENEIKILQTEKLTEIEKETELLRGEKRQDNLAMAQLSNESIETQRNITQLSGPELAEYIVQKYSEGGLGLKTLVRAFGQWMKYKF